MLQPKRWSLDWAGKTLTIEVGSYAKQADAACMCRYGGTQVLATVVQGGTPRDGVDYLPLMVDYEEKFYAAGKIKGSRFIKREGRPTDEAILMARMIDRAIRPLFNQQNRKDLQVVLTVFSADEENDPDIPAFIAASCALSLSSIAWNGPIAGIRVGLINGEYVLNPSYKARESSVLDFVVASTADQKLIMAEAEAKEVPDEKLLEAIDLAKKHNNKIIEFLVAIQKEVGVPKVKMTVPDTGLNDEELQTIGLFLDENIPSVLFDHEKATKRERGIIVDQLKEALDAYLTEKQMGKEKREKGKDMVKAAVERAVSVSIIKTGKRVDGRSLEDIRPLQIEVGVFARTHGSAHFSRGETQVVSIVTLGSPGDVQLLDTMEVEEKKYFMHHYNFPPFSVGEVRPLRGPGRRDIGHGALAEKALRAVLPPRDTFPYTIRVVSEVLSSNGSSSMASACGSSLALMDAGAPIKHHVAGIAMGVATDGEGSYTVFTDLQDLEDGQGGMDFKICGTSDGITAIQMDTKTDGLPTEVVRETFAKARIALNRLLLEMGSVIPVPRADLSEYAPRIYTLHIDPEKIGLLIGPGGKTINKIIEKTGVDIDIEKDGTVLVTSVKKDGADAAIKEIEDLTRVAKVGEEYVGKVTRVMDFGAFVELTPTQEGMVHVSNLSNEFVRSVSDVAKPGGTLNVRVIEIDEQGRINLTVVGVDPKSARGGNNDRGNFRRPDRRRQN